MSQIAFWPRVKRFAKQLVGLDPFTRPQITLLKEFHGQGYGQWCIKAKSLKSTDVVYSFGIGHDISFDLSLIEHYDVTVHGFDPTPLSIEWVQRQNLPDRFQFHPWGIGDRDGSMPFVPPDNPNHVSYSSVRQSNSNSVPVAAEIFRLSTIMANLGHEQIDLLKMDIEGMEYSVIEDILQSGIPIHQILVEFHHRFKEINVSKTKDAISRLGHGGYKIFFISPSGEEYCFVHSKRS